MSCTSTFEARGGSGRLLSKNSSSCTLPKNAGSFCLDILSSIRLSISGNPGDNGVEGQAALINQ